jgi:alkyl hydroperoxide reductase subunit AhpF
LEIGRRPTGPAPFFDDVDRSYVVAQLEGRMDAPVDLTVTVRRSSPLLLPGAAPVESAEEARRAEQLGREVAALEPRIRLTVTDEGAGDIPAFTVASRATAGAVRFLGVPRVNVFRALLETLRRASTGDPGVAPEWARALAALPRPVHAQIFATPT